MTTVIYDTNLFSQNTFYDKNMTFLDDLVSSQNFKIVVVMITTVGSEEGGV